MCRFAIVIPADSSSNQEDRWMQK